MTTDATATVTVNGTMVISGAASVQIAMKAGNNTITIVVTAQDKITKNSYTIIITRAPSSNAGLSNLILSSGTLSPAFASWTTGYRDTVSNATYSVTIMPVSSDPNSTITVNNAKIASGTASALVALNVGNNTIITVVTAQDGTTMQSYSITVTRMASSNLPFATRGTRHTESVSPDTAFGTIRPLAKDANEDKIVVHQAVSPNGDGINDFLLIEGIENYPDNKVTIINRNGIIVYRVNGYNNSSKVFDGHSNISTLFQPSGTYFYMIEYTVNEKVLRKMGYFILKYS